jgi:hypothetical protein
LPLLKTLSTRLNFSCEQIIFNRGDCEKTKAICLQTAQLVNMKSRKNGELFFFLQYSTPTDKAISGKGNLKPWWLRNPSHTTQQIPCSGSVLPTQTSGSELCKHANLRQWAGHTTSSAVLRAFMSHQGATGG